MAGGRRKCKICGEWIEDNNDSVKYKNGYAHRNCFNVAMKVVVTEKKEKLSKEKQEPKRKVQKVLKEGLSEEEYGEKVELCEYIKQLTHEELSVATYKLIEDYKKKYKISYREMKEDLFWYFEIQEKPIEGEMIIGIIPIFHTTAQKNLQEIKASQNSFSENLKNIPRMYQEKSRAMSKGRPEKVFQIDIAGIGGDKK